MSLNAFIGLLLLFESFQGGTLQLLDWNGDLEGSGKISSSDRIMLASCCFLVFTVNYCYNNSFF